QSSESVDQQNFQNATFQCLKEDIGIAKTNSGPLLTSMPEYLLRIFLKKKAKNGKVIIFGRTNDSKKPLAKRTCLL
ncbi:hypothetical protein BpHYR1_035097, partial [Brachionus plicatilis]